MVAASRHSVGTQEESTGKTGGKKGKKRRGRGRQAQGLANEKVAVWEARVRENWESWEAKENISNHGAKGNVAELAPVGRMATSAAMLDRNATPPSTFEVHVTGQVESGTFLGDDNLYCNILVHHGVDWQVATKDLVAVICVIASVGCCWDGRRSDTGLTKCLSRVGV
eukprot:768050-Hanusia_phi.AAC.6